MNAWKQLWQERDVVAVARVFDGMGTLTGISPIMWHLPDERAREAIATEVLREHALDAR